MLRTDKAPINMTGNNMGGTVASPTIATGSQMAGDAMDAAAGRTLGGTGRAEGLVIDTTYGSVALAGGSSAGMTICESFGAGQTLADIAGKGMLTAKRMTVTGAGDRATFPNRLLAFMAGQGVCRTMNAATLRASSDAGWAKAPGAAPSSARLKMNSAVVASAMGIGAARGAGGAANLAAGATAHLILCAGNFVAAGAARCAVGAERRLVDMAGECMRWATGAATGGAGTRTGDAERSVGDRAARLVIRAGAVPTIFSFSQTDITNPCAID